jgi:hypothetical protein
MSKPQGWETEADARDVETWHKPETAIAIRDTDEPKFSVCNADFYIADSAWWALRVIDWALHPGYNRYLDPASVRGSMEQAHKQMVWAVRQAAFSREMERWS